MLNLSYLDDPWPEPDLDDDCLYDDSEGGSGLTNDVEDSDADYFDRWADDWPVEDPNMGIPDKARVLEVEDLLPGHLIRSWELD